MECQPCLLKLSVIFSLSLSLSVPLILTWDSTILLFLILQHHISIFDLPWSYKSSFVKLWWMLPLLIAKYLSLITIHSFWLLCFNLILVLISPCPRSRLGLGFTQAFGVMLIYHCYLLTVGSLFPQWLSVFPWPPVYYFQLFNSLLVDTGTHMHLYFGSHAELSL